jgi:hypothetical protein
VKDKLAAREVKEGDTVGVFVSEKHQHASMSGLLPSVVIQIKPATANGKTSIRFADGSFFLFEKHQHASMSGLLPSVVIQIKPATANGKTSIRFADGSFFLFEKHQHASMSVFQIKKTCN